MKKPFLITAILLSVVMVSGAMSVAAQDIRVSGRVVDDRSNEPVIGCSVVVKGTTKGVTTDFDGQYSIDVPAGGTLVFSYVGMGTREMPVNAGSVMIDVSMQTEDNALDEVVVVGYGTQTKQSVVGAIGQVKSDDLARTGGVTTVSNALTGLVPGLTTLNYSGKPGADQAQIQIRAMSTWNGSSPLILVDGVEKEDINSVDVTEIESISILKDASATAVFGVRGGNGVILITTKRGREGKPVMSVTANVTAKTKSRIAANLDSYNVRWLKNQAIENQMGLPTLDEAFWQSNITPVGILRAYRDQTDPERYPNINWQDEMLKKLSWSQRYSMDVSGGTKFVKYFASLAYLYDGDVIKGRDMGQGYIPKNDYSRYNYRLNLDFTPTKTTTLSVDLDGAQGIERSTLTNTTYLWTNILQKGPDEYPIRLSSLPGAPFVNNGGTNQYNPVEYFNFSGMDREVRIDMNTSFNLKQKLDFITKGLSFNALVNFKNYYIGSGPDIEGSRPLTYYFDSGTGESRPNDLPQPDKSGFDYEPFPNNITTENIANKNGIRQVQKYMVYQAALNYDATFAQKHRVTGLVNFRRSDKSMGQVFSSLREEWAGRVTYAYDNRYLMEANGSYTGSEMFTPGQKFGFFPSASLGWVVTEESFVKKLRLDDYLNFMKFRFSWGKTGNDNIDGVRWLYETAWASINSTALLGYPNPEQAGNRYPGYKVTNIGNPDAKWETAIKYNVGVDAMFLKNRLSATFDYFWGKRYDVFMNAELRTVPPWFGAPAVAGNIGRTKDKGWELEAKWNATTSFGMHYFATASVSYSEDMILYYEDAELTLAYRKKAGFPIGQPTSKKSDGIITSWDEMYNSPLGESPDNNLPGMYRIIDYDGNGVINNYDVVPVGYPNRPRYMTNITLGAEWKGVSVMVQFYGTQDSNLWQSASEWRNDFSVVDNSIWGDMWLPVSNPGGTYRSPVYGIGGDVAASADYNLVDGTQWRLKNAEIAYSFTNKGLGAIGIDNVRVYLNGNNLWLWSRLNEDRETGGPRQVTGGHAVMYPLQRRINFGVKIEF